MAKCIDKTRRGEQRSKAKLTDGQVRGMRSLYKDGHSFATLGRLYGVSACSAAAVCKGWTWGHVKDTPKIPTRRHRRDGLVIKSPTERQITLGKTFNDMSVNGTTIRQISTKYGLSATSVYNYINVYKASAIKSEV